MAAMPVAPTTIGLNRTPKVTNRMIIHTDDDDITIPSLTNAEKIHMTERPLKYVGYPLFTSFLASSPETVILRRFDKIHVRVLLKLQDEIVRKEERIDIIDQFLSRIEYPVDLIHVNGSFRKDESAKKDRAVMADQLEERSALLKELTNDIKVYDEMILNYRQLRSDPEPSKRNIHTVRTYLENWRHEPRPRSDNEKHCGPIWQEEAEYIYKDGDLLELVPEDKPPLRKWAEKWTWFMLGWWFRRRPSGTQRYTDFLGCDEVLYQSDRRINGFITILTLTFGLALLIVPLEGLNLIGDQRTKLHVICGLIAVFLIITSSIMPARPWETLAATAAYSAVLMVFMQINSRGTSDPSSG